MTTHYNGCSWLKEDGMPCDLDGNRSYLCEACLSYLIKQERPEGWSPRVPKKDTEKKDDR